MARAPLTGIDSWPRIGAGTMGPTTILLADDHRIVREGFKMLLAAEADFHIVGETGDGLEAARLAEQLTPDVVVTDLIMPSLRGLELVRLLKQRVPQTKIVILSMHSNEPFVIDALRQGASAYVLKDSSAADLVHAVREAMAGRRYLSPPLSQPAIEAYLLKAKKAALTDPFDSLTSRELEVLRLVAEGQTSSQIAGRLFISPRTVEIHRANVVHKLGLRSQAELIHYSYRKGILKVPENLNNDK